METQKYRALLRSIDLGSFSAAAEEMGFTPSGVSHMVDAVEAEIGFALLKRSRHGVSLTPGGESLLPRLRELVHAEALLNQQASEMRGVTYGKVVVSCYSSVATHWMSLIIRMFRCDYPNISIKLLEGVHNEVKDWMTDYLVDFSLSTRIEKPNWQWIPLKKDPMLVILPPGHPLCQEDAITPERCNGLPFIMPGGRGNDHDVVALLKEVHVEPDIKFSTIENYSVLSMVEHGLGISIMNELITKGRTNRVVMLPFCPPRHIVLGITVPSLSQATPAAKRMIEYIRTILSGSESETAAQAAERINMEAFRGNGRSSLTS